MNNLVDAYLATWNSSPEERPGLLAQHFSTELTYTDPVAQVVGHAGMHALVDGVHQQFPGFVFTAVGQADAHSNLLRFRWGLGPEDAEPIVIGFDVVVLDEAGRIRDVHGFLDEVPA